MKHVKFLILEKVRRLLFAISYTCSVKVKPCITEGEVETADISHLTDETLANTEADTYWCLSKLLDNLHDNYTFAQPGIQMKVHDLRRLVNRMDGN